MLYHIHAFKILKLNSRNLLDGGNQNAAIKNFSERKLPLPFLKITLKKIRRRRREKRTSADFTLRII
jgi:hypothetical protein